MSTATIARSYLTPPEVAELLGVAAEKVCGFIRRGELRATNVATTLSGRPRWRIHRADLEAFLAARGNLTPPPATRQRRKRDESVIEYF